MNTPPECRSDNSEPPHAAPHPPVSGSKPWVRYRVQYRSHTTNELLDQKDTRDPRDKIWCTDETEVGDGPAFDIIKTIRTQDPERDKLGHGGTEPSRLPVTLSPSYSIRIHSPQIINAIQSVVKYYPSQDLTGSPVVVQWPYAVLVHHYDELHDFIGSVNELEPEKRCNRERNVGEHLQLLFDYLEESVMPSVREERERNSRGYCTFEWLWVFRKPGKTEFVAFKGSLEPQAYVIHSLEQGSFVNPSMDWTTTYWYLNFDGECLGRQSTVTTVSKWDGETLLAGTARIIEFPEDLEGDDAALADTNFDDDVKQRIQDGGIYWKLLRKQCQWYSGKTVDFPYNNVRSSH